MRFLRPAMAALVLGACAPAHVAPAFAQECVCPPAEGVSAGPVIQSDETPPPLPDYDQPPMPAPGYTWTPGYWAWNNDDYYWAPGVWVEPPQPGLLWTPGYWAFVGGVYLFHRGYWAPHVGFYGGVHYGYGYNGVGYEGGRWDNGRFFYNAAVNNFGSLRLVNVYSQPVTVPPGVGRASYNGGPGGNLLKPTPEQERLTTEPRIPPTPAQRNQVRAASVNPQQFISTNQGKPAVAATPRPGQFQGPGVVPAKAGAALSVPTTGPAGQPPTPNAVKLPVEKPLGATPAQPPALEKPAGGAPNELQRQQELQRLQEQDRARALQQQQDQQRQQQQDSARARQQQQDMERARALQQQQLQQRALQEQQMRQQMQRPPAQVERPPVQPGGKPQLECGRPGLPPCPK